MTLDPRAERTALRLKLYNNGFSPLANKMKLCLIKEWSTLKVTPEIIESRQWARAHAFMDTGIRCGDVIALDFDVDDPDLLNDLLDKVVELGLVDESPFVRIGRPPRELWVYRTSEKIGKRTTGHFVPPDSPEDFSGYAVEILGAGCQFAAFGQRDENTAYQWPEESLVDHVYMDLPVITLKQVEALKDFCEVFFAGHGLTRASAGGGTDGGYTHVYDLTPDMVFNVKDQGDMTVAELAEALAINPDETWRCTVDTFRPTSGSWAGMVSLVNGVVCISDHGTYTSHFPAESDTATSMEALGRLLAEKFPEAVAEPPVDLDFNEDQTLNEKLEIALARYIYIETDSQVCDLHFDLLMRPLQSIRDSLAPHYSVQPGPRGGEKRTELWQLWHQHGKRKSALDAGVHPAKTRPLFTGEDGHQHLNLYAPPVHPSGGDASVGLDFLQRLVPDADERTFFTQWLSHKLQHPEIPGPAVMMVANNTYGTGRGSLISLIGAMFGKRYVKTINFDTLAGKGMQSQYNEWLSESLIVAVDEAQEVGAHVSKWQSRHNAYEYLKTIIDPAEREAHIIRKTFKNTYSQVYASIFVATNHSDAIVIPPDDRRIAVLENGQASLPDYWLRFHAWRADPHNVGAFVRELLRFSLTGYNAYAPPMMTRAKTDMIEAGTSDLDRAAAMVLAKPAGGLMVKEQFLLKLEDTIVDMNLTFPEDWQRAAERMFTRLTRRLLGPDRHLVDGKMRSIRMVGAVEAAVLQDLPAMLEEVARNGPIIRPIRSSSTVVNFPGSRKTL